MLLRQRGRVHLPQLLGRHVLRAPSHGGQIPLLLKGIHLLLDLLKLFAFSQLFHADKSSVLLFLARQFLRLAGGGLLAETLLHHPLGLFLAFFDDHPAFEGGNVLGFEGGPDASVGGRAVSQEGGAIILRRGDDGARRRESYFLRCLGVGGRAWREVEARSWRPAKWRFCW